MTIDNNPLEQYILLHDRHRDLIERHAPEPLNAMRQRARQAIEHASLPRRGAEDYEATDLPALFAPDYGINIARRDVDLNAAAAFHCDVPNLSTCLYLMHNDSVRPATHTQPAGQGIIIAPMTEVARLHPDLLSRYYGSLADLNDPTVALNTLLAQDGLVVYVPDGVVAEKPVQLVNLLGGNAPVMAVRRLLIVAGEGARVTVLACDHTRDHTHSHLASEVVEIVAGPDSHVDYYDLEESGANTRRVATVAVDQAAGSDVTLCGITLTNGITRNDYTVQVGGERAETRLMGMAIASGSQHVDNHTLIRHRAPRCHSNEMLKYVLSEKAVGAFAGKILVEPGCPRVEAYQGNKNIIADDTAKMHTKPQLEIYTDDVKCSHGTTIGQLDDEALFYMQSRGISREVARTLLMQAFMTDVIDTVRLDSLRDRLRYLVEKRFRNELASCGTCAICPQP